MRVVVAHSPDVPIRQMRHAMMSAGLECANADCVTYENLAMRISQESPDLVALQLTSGQNVDWGSLREAIALTNAPLMVVAPEDIREQAQRELDPERLAAPEEMREKLDSLVLQISGSGTRGQILAVYAPIPGCGATTVAANLAAALNKSHPERVGLIELSPGIGDLGLLLNAEPEHTIVDACKQAERLDLQCLGRSAVTLESGLRLLSNRADGEPNRFLSVASVKRLSILSRLMWAHTVIAVDAGTDDALLEALRCADRVVFVVRPDVVAVRRAQQTLSRCAELGIDSDRFFVVGNRWGQGGQLTQKQIEETLQFPVRATIPNDASRVNSAANKGVLLQDVSSMASITRKFSALAKELNGTGSKRK